MYARLLASLSLGTILLAGCPGDPDDDAPADDDGGDDDGGDDDGGDDDSGPSELDAFILEQMEVGRIPGLAASVVRDGEIAWSAGYGWADIEAGRPATPDTEFLLASVSKTVTAVALMQVWETGAFELDDDVDQHLPFAVDNPSHPGEPITVRQLLTHTSSIRDNWSVMDTLYVDGDSPIALGAFLEDYLTPAGAHYDAEKNFLQAAPGQTMAYSNIGAALAGYLVEAITATPFDAWCEDHIFDPLQMDGCGWHLADVDLDQLAVPYRMWAGDFVPVAHYGWPDYPDGQLRCDVEELGHFLASFIDDGSWGDETILLPATVEQMRTVQFPALDPTQGLIWYYWTLQGDELLGHDGGEVGASTDLFYRVADGVGVIVLINGDSEQSWGAMEAIEARLYDEGPSL